jgi:ABC-type sugar transport system permease subunit
MKKRHEQKLIILSIGLLIAFSIPLSLLFNSSREVSGYPMILVYIFAVWMISIIISFVIVKKYNE